MNEGKGVHPGRTVLKEGGAGGREPWIETREGGWFFVNALLIMPELVVLIPLVARGVVSLLAPHRPPSPFLDTIPFVASRALPFSGWLLVVPMGTVLWNLRLERKLLPRLFLVLFLVLHLAFFGYTVRSWMG